MSWQAYVDDQLVGTECVTGAAIIGHDGQVWAAKNLALKNGEGAAVAALFNNSQAAFSSGIVVGGVKHLCIRADARSVYGKKVRAPLCLHFSIFFLSLLFSFFFFFFSSFCSCSVAHSLTRARVDRRVPAVSCV